MAGKDNWAAVPVIGPGVLTVTMSFILYMNSGWPHMLSTGIMAVLIGSLLFAMAVLSRPFVGPLAVDPKPFETSLSDYTDIDNVF